MDKLDEERFYDEIVTKIISNLDRFNGIKSYKEIISKIEEKLKKHNTIIKFFKKDEVGVTIIAELNSNLDLLYTVGLINISSFKQDIHHKFNLEYRFRDIIDTCRAILDKKLITIRNMNVIEVLTDMSKVTELDYELFVYSLYKKTKNVRNIFEGTPKHSSFYYTIVKHYDKRIPMWFAKKYTDVEQNKWDEYINHVDLISKIDR